MNLISFFSYFRTSSGGKFKYYCYYVVAVAFLAFLIMILIHNYVTLYALLFVVIAACITCFIFAAMKIYDMTGVDIDFGRKRFSHEEQRFMIYFHLFIITIVTWTIENCVFEFSESYNSLIISDIIGCLQGVLLFFILILKKNSREIIIRRLCCC